MKHPANTICTLSFYSSREHDIGAGILIGMGFSVRQIKTSTLPFTVRIDGRLTRNAVEIIQGQIQAYINFDRVNR